MGFFIFATTAIAFMMAAVISASLGVIGIILYTWRGRSRKPSKQAFWYVLAGSIVIGVLVINLVPFPQAPAGSNYGEWLNEWVIKAVVYALIPGVASLLGGVTSVFTGLVATRDT